MWSSDNAAEASNLRELVAQDLITHYHLTTPEIYILIRMCRSMVLSSFNSVFARINLTPHTTNRLAWAATI